jgi:hypothetical protein
MGSTFGILDAFAFVVFAVLIVAAVIIFVSLGRLPGRLARKWDHPQASAVNVAGWIGMATGGLLWPLALIWAFITPSRSDASVRGSARSLCERTGEGGACPGEPADEERRFAAGIDPAPYQYTVDQLEAQLKASKANVDQAQAGAQAADANVTKAKAGVTQAQAAVDQAKAGVANAQANLNKAKASDDLAKTQEQIALNIQRADVAAISQLKVAEAKQ